MGKSYRHLLRIWEKQSCETRSCLEITQGQMATTPISTILSLMWLGCPLMKTQPNVWWRCSLVLPAGTPYHCPALLLAAPGGKPVERPALVLWRPTDTIRGSANCLLGGSDARPIHSKSEKVCRFSFSVSKYLRKKVHKSRQKCAHKSSKSQELGVNGHFC